MSVRVYKALLLFVVVGTHFFLRDYAARTVPLNARGGYPEDYSVAISVAVGKGFNGFSLRGLQPMGLLVPEAPQARPIVRFLRWGQDSLSRSELDEYFRTAYSPTPPSPLSSTRILELQVAGILWKIFGVRWSTIFHFYSILSAFVCLLIFLIARKLSGSYWAGCLAAIIYAVSPQEIKFGVISSRDISPFWFGSIAFFWLVVLTDRVRSAFWNFASIAGLGGVSLLGYGWRTDALLFPPFIFTVLIIWMSLKRRGLKYAIIAGLCFVVGCWAMIRTISALGPNASSLSPNIFYEVANYGQFTRSNLFHLENSFQIPENDFETFALTNFHWSLRHPTEPLPSYLSDRYGIAGRQLYWAYFKYNIFNWYWEFPSFYINSLRDLALPKQFRAGSPPPIVFALSVGIPVFFIAGLPVIFL